VHSRIDTTRTLQKVERGASHTGEGGTLIEKFLSVAEGLALQQEEKSQGGLKDPSFKLTTKNEGGKKNEKHGDYRLARQPCRTGRWEPTQTRESQEI